MKKLNLPTGHKPLVTRRDFIAHGLMKAGAMMMAPSALSYLLKGSEAFAQTAPSCPMLGPDAGLIPFLAIDCAGGPSLSGNVIVGSQTTGALVPLTSYNTLGIPYIPTSTPNSIDTRFGTAFHTGPAPADTTKPISKVFEGMVSAMAATTQANVRIVTLCHFSQDDSQNNEMNPILAVTQAGLRGRLIKNGLGTEKSLSGANSAPSLSDSEYRPLYVSSVKTVVDALSYGSILSAYPAVYREKMANAISNLSLSQATNFKSLSLADQFSTLVNCGFITNKNFATTTPDIDPRTNTVMQQVYGVTATSNDTNTQRAAIVYNAIQGNSGPGVITIGGCDYHNNVVPTDPTHGDFKDLEIGREIGRAVEAAARLGKSLFISVYADGSVYGAGGARQWIGDSGSRNVSFMVYYRPTGPATIRKPQIGNFTTGQTVNANQFYSNNQKFASYIHLANYLSVCGLLGNFAGLAPSGFNTSTAVVDSLIGFG